MSSQTQALRSLLATGKPFIAADCYSALTGRIVERAGFPAAYMGGHATGMMHYAIPDNGVLTPTEMIDQARRVAEAISIPLLVDADQLGESIADVHRSVLLYERAGVAGVHMEDERTPKHSTFDGPLLPIVDMQARISAAAGARRDEDFLLIARCDEFYDVGGGGSGSLEEAIRRGKAYAEAGADVFLPTMATPEQVAEDKERGAGPHRGVRFAHRRLCLRAFDRMGDCGGGQRTPEVGRATSWPTGSCPRSLRVPRQAVVHRPGRVRRSHR